MKMKNVSYILSILMMVVMNITMTAAAENIKTIRNQDGTSRSIDFDEEQCPFSQLSLSELLREHIENHPEGNPFYIIEVKETRKSFYFNALDFDEYVQDGKSSNRKFINNPVTIEPLYLENMKAYETRDENSELVEIPLIQALPSVGINLAIKNIAITEEFLSQLDQYSNYFPYISELVLSKNNLKTIPTDLLERTPNLQELFISYNDIETPVIPTSLLPYLHTLTLDHDNIQEVKEISTLQNLKSLDLTHNNIKTLTPLQQQPNLSLLSADENFIRELRVPTEPQLKVVSLRNNKIRTAYFPSFDAAPKIQAFYLDGNPIKSGTKTRKALALWATEEKSVDILDGFDVNQDGPNTPLRSQPGTPPTPRLPVVSQQMILQEQKSPVGSQTLTTPSSQKKHPFRLPQSIERAFRTQIPLTENTPASSRKSDSEYQGDPTSSPAQQFYQPLTPRLLF